MKILAVADEESPYLYDYYKPGRLSGIDVIVACGDLKQEYLEFLVTMSSATLCYVPGNHDKGYINFPPEGCECIDDRVMDVGGLRIAGLGGCRRYNLGVYQYTDSEMKRRVNALDRKISLMGGLDILITHAPPRGYGDAEDNAHIGFEAFLPLMNKYKPQYLIHGHVHPSYGNLLPRKVQYNETTVYNAVGWHLLDVEPKPHTERGTVKKLLYRLMKKREKKKMSI